MVDSNFALKASGQSNFSRTDVGGSYFENKDRAAGTLLFMKARGKRYLVLNSWMREAFL